MPAVAASSFRVSLSADDERVVSEEDPFGGKLAAQGSPHPPDPDPNQLNIAATEECVGGLGDVGPVEEVGIGVQAS